MYYLLAICLAFSLLLILHLAVSVTASAIWRAISPFAARSSARRREQITFVPRVFPAVSAVLFVLAFLVPAYLLFEPYSACETISLKMAAIAIASAAGVAFATFRVYRTWSLTRRLTNSWLEQSDPIQLEGVDIPVYCLRHPFPVIAVVGFVRPRLFIASQIFDSLSGEEFRAAIAHEYGHLRSHDNLKRTMLQVCRDLLIFPFGRRLDREWAINTEAAADEYAAKAGDGSTALNLAAALIKIARIVPGGARPAMPLASYLIDERDGHLSDRISRLIEISGDGRASTISLRSSRMSWLYAVPLVFMVLLFSANSNVLLSIHYAYELFVHALR
jgi:Zn-dependent protease with chaperone function